jgi:vacuolar protein-sorting-associated protein 4
MLLSDTANTPSAQAEVHAPCRFCRAERKTLYEVPSEKLKVPLITYADFEKALSKAHSSVGHEELQRFVSWTEEFGQEG